MVIHGMTKRSKLNHVSEVKDNLESLHNSNHNGVCLLILFTQNIFSSTRNEIPLPDVHY